MTSPLIIPDTMALIHLASIRRLDLLPRMGQAVLVDMVEHEATHRTDKPFAHDLAFWTNMRSMVGGDREPVYADTAVYREYMKRKASDPSHKARDAGEVAIIEWANANASFSARGVIIVSNDKKMPTRLRKAQAAGLVTVLPADKFLDVAEQLGLLGDAGAAWRRVQQAAANPPPRKLWGQTP